jgi:hypothetical protein
MFIFINKYQYNAELLPWVQHGVVGGGAGVLNLLRVSA